MIFRKTVLIEKYTLHTQIVHLLMSQLHGCKVQRIRKFPEDDLTFLRGEMPLIEFKLPIKMCFVNHDAIWEPIVEKFINRADFESDEDHEEEIKKHIMRFLKSRALRNVVDLRKIVNFDEYTIMEDYWDKDFRNNPE